MRKSGKTRRSRSPASPQPSPPTQILVPATPEAVSETRATVEDLMRPLTPRTYAQVVMGMALDPAPLTPPTPRLQATDRLTTMVEIPDEGLALPAQVYANTAGAQSGVQVAHVESPLPPSSPIRLPTTADNSVEEANKENAPCVDPPPLSQTDSERMWAAVGTPIPLPTDTAFSFVVPTPPLPGAPRQDEAAAASISGAFSMNPAPTNDDLTSPLTARDVNVRKWPRRVSPGSDEQTARRTRRRRARAALPSIHEDRVLHPSASLTTDNPWLSANPRARVDDSFGPPIASSTPARQPSPELEYLDPPQPSLRNINTSGHPPTPHYTTEPSYGSLVRAETPLLPVPESPAGGHASMEMRMDVDQTSSREVRPATAGSERTGMAASALLSMAGRAEMRDIRHRNDLTESQQEAHFRAFFGAQASRSNGNLTPANSPAVPEDSRFPASRARAPFMQARTREQREEQEALRSVRAPVARPFTSTLDFHDAPPHWLRPGTERTRWEPGQSASSTGFPVVPQQPLVVADQDGRRPRPANPAAQCLNPAQPLEDDDEADEGGWIPAAVTRGRGAGEEALDEDPSLVPMSVFRRIQLSDLESHLRGLDDRWVRAMWRDPPNTTALINIFNYTFTTSTAVNRTTAMALREAVRQITGERAFHVVPPDPAPGAVQAGQPPILWAIRGLSPVGWTTLVRFGLWTSGAISFHAMPTALELPDWLLSLENLTSDDPLEIERTVRGTLERGAPRAHIRALLQGNRDFAGVPLDEAFQTIMATLRIQVLTLGNGNLIANVYMRPPTRNAARWREWVRSLRSMSFGIYLGATAHPRRITMCAGCHSVDHPTHLCPFTRLPGWQGPEAGTGNIGSYSLAISGGTNTTPPVAGPSRARGAERTNPRTPSRRGGRGGRGGSR
ncbi:hypothetical protein C8Q76DRAFT_799693 [Earliella scabrosa]|nr:hypothetical protein C8Q76DRAFT_799693 [Earliella scabrosa]